MAEQGILGQLQAELVAYLHDDKSTGKLAGKLEALTGVPREQLSAVAAGLLAVYLIFGYFAQLVCGLIGFAYPAYASMLAIESVDKADDTQWLTYWTVFAVFSLLDFGAEKICGWFPLYWLVKCIFLIYLYEPHFNGAAKLYVSTVRPLIQWIYRLIMEGGAPPGGQAPAQAPAAG